MTSFRNVFVLVLRQALQRRKALALTVFSTFPALVLIIVSGSSLEPFDLYHEFTAGGMLSVAFPVSALIIATGAFGEERRGHTLPYVVTKPIPRWVLAAAFTAAAVVATLAVTAAGLGIGWIVGSVTANEGAIGWANLVGLAVIALGYSAAFVPLGLIFRRATLLGIAYIFLWERIFGGIVDTIGTSSLSRTAVSAYASVDDRLPELLRQDLGTMLPGAGGAFAKAAVLMLISLAVTTLVLRRKDAV